MGIVPLAHWAQTRLDLPNRHSFICLRLQDLEIERYPGLLTEHSASVSILEIVRAPFRLS